MALLIVVFQHLELFTPLDCDRELFLPISLLYLHLYSDGVLLPSSGVVCQGYNSYSPFPASAPYRSAAACCAGSVIAASLSTSTSSLSAGAGVVNAARLSCTSSALAGDVIDARLSCASSALAAAAGDAVAAFLPAHSSPAFDFSVDER